MADFIPKINWQPDDPVTEGDFNRIEQGIADAHGKADNLKTQITEGSIQVNSAENADNLGGKPPEYYAKQSEVNEHLEDDATDAHQIKNITGLQTALDNKINSSEKGQPNGVSVLDEEGKVPEEQLPDIKRGQFVARDFDGQVIMSQNPIYEELDEINKGVTTEGVLFTEFTTHIDGAKFLQINLLAKNPHNTRSCYIRCVIDSGDSQQQDGFRLEAQTTEYTLFSFIFFLSGELATDTLKVEIHGEYIDGFVSITLKDIRLFREERWDVL